MLVVNVPSFILKVSTPKTSSNNYFCFLGHVCYLVLQVTYDFYELPNGSTHYLLEMYCYFPVIRLVTFVQGAFKPHFKNQVSGRIPHRLSQEGERGEGVIGQALGTNIRYV